MSRSIHKTRREVAHEMGLDYANAALRDTRVEHIQEQLDRKRRIKKQVKTERRLPHLDVAPVLPESLPIRVLDEGQYVHYPASPTDLEAVMRSLPPGMLNGIDSVCLCLGAERQLELRRAKESGAKPDPFTGRHGYQSLPGVYGGRSRGTYSPESGEISIFAYVYDSGLRDREMWELYLRLEMLSTFIHEVMHNYDLTRRVGRGRWLADDTNKVEDYAEVMGYRMLQEYIVPYLERAYSEEVAVLERWISYHGGISLPLQLLTRDPTNGLSDFFSIPIALEQLAEDVAKGEPLSSTRLQFARELHYAEYYGEALTIIDGILAIYPNSLEALTLQADIFVHQGKYETAKTLTSQVVSRDGQYNDAWRVLADVYERTEDWLNLEMAATRVIEHLELGDQSRVVPLEQRARARLELGDFNGCEADMEELTKLRRSKALLKRISALREEMLARKRKDGL